jgi:hypothetical protein
MGLNGKTAEDIQDDFGESVVRALNSAWPK